MKKTFSRHFSDAFKEFLADKENRSMLLLAIFGPVAAGLILVGIAFATDTPVKPLEPLVGLWSVGMTGFVLYLGAEAAARMRDQCD